jgi:hypothetical protein
MRLFNLLKKPESRSCVAHLVERETHHSVHELLLDQVVDLDHVCLLIDAFTFFDRGNCILGPPNVLYLSMQENDLDQGFSR